MSQEGSCWIGSILEMQHDLFSARRVESGFEEPEFSLFDMFGKVVTSFGLGIYSFFGTVSRLIRELVVESEQMCGEKLCISMIFSVLAVLGDVFGSLGVVLAYSHTYTHMQELTENSGHD